jgi:glycosyltransferase involved in cell wall biosynthesis
MAKSGRKFSSLFLCFSHLRWNFVLQRPQHLLTRAAETRQVLYIEEPVYEMIERPTLKTVQAATNISVITPVLPKNMQPNSALGFQRILVNMLIAAKAHEELILWYYTPMALAFSSHIKSDVCVYDCMDELSAFKNPPAGLAEWEEKLFAQADIVFTGGQSLYEAKRGRHPQVYAFPSSIDAQHFNKARTLGVDPEDQASIAKPRIGYFGVIDERMDLDLVAIAAAALPDINFIMIGPVVKIDPATLPKASNIHWLGNKQYAQLPDYLAHWQAGWMPFALNDSTKYISPTKTPEFLAAGLPVASTAIVDVMRTYGARGLVQIGDRSDMPAKLRSLIGSRTSQWLQQVDSYLSSMSWDKTWKDMEAHINHAMELNTTVALRKGA